MITISDNDKHLKTHWESVEPQLVKRISDVLRKGYIRKGKKVAKQSIIVTPELRMFLNLLQNEGLKKLVYAKPEKLKQIIRIIENKWPSFINRTDGKGHDDNVILYSIFVDHGYEFSHEKNPCFDKLKFINNISIDTCPYCNRSYIYALGKKGKIKPEIDHFYPKSIYPFLAITYCNLIPSCQTCNGYGGKHSSDTYIDNVRNPYLIKNEEFKFSYEIVSIGLLNPISNSGSIKITLSKKIRENIDLFKLEDLYQKHEDHVLELIIKSQLEYTKKYREYLKSYKGLYFSDSEIDRMIVGNYTKVDELHKRPLSKLYRDIALELNLITE